MRRALALSASMCVATSLYAQSPSTTGQTGLINMPDARLSPEGAWRTGLSFSRPYQALWSSIGVLPWLETSFRYTRVYHVPGFSQGSDPGFGANFGDFKDKSLDAKVLLLPERGAWPALAAGVQDAAGGTGVFRAPYAVASKKLGELDLTLGWGAKRIDGPFGGVRWSPAEAAPWSLIAEYDAYDYKHDFGAELSGAASHRKGPAIGVEYRQDWYGAKVFAAHGSLGFNAYVSIPLEQREFVPKIHEPPPYTKVNPRPSDAQWHEDGAHRTRLAQALVMQDFRDVSLRYDNGRLEAVLTNARISSMPRAVGRAARTLLSFAPLQVREIRITYQQATLSVATYTFVNVPLLQRYFNGMASREQLAPHVEIRYAQPGDAREERDRAETLAAFGEPVPELLIGRDGGDLMALRGENVLGGLLRVRPGLKAYLNDPSGAFRFELSAIGSFDRALGRQTFLQAETKLTVYEDVSKVTQASNSVLPHVRSDIAEYERGSKLKLTRLLVNRFYQPGERLYARASAGVYEEMYGGAGGQVLYLPRSGSWAADAAVDWVKQRDFHGWFGFRDYSTVTAIGSVHYRMAHGLTATLRAGRFLARDEGVRAELKRRFKSGFEIGGWYTVTNGKDITSPGTPSTPYHDKGIFIAIPFEPLMTYDVPGVAGIAISPWTRDVGQMVASPADLYRILERPVWQMHEHDGLVRFGERDDDYDLPSLGADRRWPELVADDFFGARRAAGNIDWVQSAVLGAGLVAGSAVFDKRVFRFADQHRNASWLKQGVRMGDLLPVGALGLSALFAFDPSRPRLSDTGIAALEAGALAFVATEGLKYAAGRARPTTGLGNTEFKPGNSKDAFHSFPSRHTALMWAAITPYAKEYDAPWLYGLAALTNAARAGSREHWFSDTVAGAALGYALGHLAWDAGREARSDKSSPTVQAGLNSIALRWDFQ